MLFPIKIYVNFQNQVINTLNMIKKSFTTKLLIHNRLCHQQSGESCKMLLLKVIYIKGGPRTDPCGMPKYKAATPG